MLPTVQISSLEVTRLIIGGNPFSGFSHQSPKRDQEMLDYYTVARLKQALCKAETAGINTTVMRSDTHIQRMLREYYSEGGNIQWIAQIGHDSEAFTLERAVDQAVANGAAAAFIHGGVLDRFYSARNSQRVSELIDHIHSHNIPAGVAGHAPQAHLWAYELDVDMDFQTFCFYNCGSLHDGKGDTFSSEDPAKACQAIGRIQRPILAYKIMGAGRVEPRQAFEYAFANIKDTDAVVVGMHLGDNEKMIEENAQMVAASIKVS